MGRKRSKSNTYRSDDAFDISSESELLRNFIKKQPLTPSVHLNPPKFDLKSISDHRRFTPEPLAKPAGALKRSATRLVVAKPPKASPRASLPHRLAFQAPAHVVVCVRRKQRKEVLFAKRLTRRGANARRRSTKWSSIKC